VKSWGSNSPADDATDAGYCRKEPFPLTRNGLYVPIKHQEEDNMPIVQIDFIEGRTVEQKRELVKKVTQAICESLDCPAEAVSIILRDVPKTNIARAGVLRSDNK
jgi:4-oxalocrotonate tautomerase